MNAIYDLPLTLIDGSQTLLAPWRERLLLIVNTASRCGFTSQYAGLEALYQRYRERGLMVLGFPCNQFGGQEPGSEDEIAGFCERDYGISFPMFAKVEVNGPHAHPLFVALKKQAPGLLGSEGIKWNFTKFLVAPGGAGVERFAPTVTPAALAEPIERGLPVQVR